MSFRPEAPACSPPDFSWTLAGRPGRLLQVARSQSCCPASSLFLPVRTDRTLGRISATCLHPPSNSQLPASSSPSHMGKSPVSPSSRVKEATIQRQWAKRRPHGAARKNQSFVLGWGPWGTSASLAYLERFVFYNEQQRRRGEERRDRPKAGLRKRDGRRLVRSGEGGWKSTWETYVEPKGENQE